MNFKTKAFGLVAAVGLALGIAAPTLADTTSNTATVTVGLTENGVFAVSITGASLSNTTTNAATTGSSTGSLTIVYQDTKSFRAGFDTTLYADDFTSSLAIPYGSGNYGLDATNFFITRNYDSAHGRWSSQGPRIGDIGPTSRGSENDHSGGPYTTPGYHNWTNAADNNLDSTSPPLVGFGFRGPGTAGSANTNGSTQLINIQLNPPAGQPATTYTTTLHVTVTFGWDPI
jgi:hypothetical protein